MTRQPITRGGIVTAALVVLACLAPEPADAHAPSFAVWMAHRDARVAKMLAPVQSKCVNVARLTSDDDAAGKCLIDGLWRVWPRSRAAFDRSVAIIAAPQTAPCKRAIHAWWRAISTGSRAMLVYLTAAHDTPVSATRFNRDMRNGTLGTLNGLTDAAKSRALRVCA